MNWVTPLEIGITMGLIFAFSVVALSVAFRLLNFPDLTLEGSVPLGAAVFAAMLRRGVNIPISALLACTVGALAGALTAGLHVKFRLNKFLCGILVVAISYSIALHVMSAPNIGLLGVLGFSEGSSILPLAAALILPVALLGWFLQTRTGTRLRAAGSSAEFARSVGIPAPLYLIFGLALVNALAAASGVTLAYYQGFSDVGMGQGMLIMALAAMTVGERLVIKTHLSRPTYVLVAACLGSIVYQVLVAYGLAAGVPATDLKLVTAILVLVVLALRVPRFSKAAPEWLS